MIQVATRIPTLFTMWRIIKLLSWLSSWWILKIENYQPPRKSVGIIERIFPHEFSIPGHLNPGDRKPKRAAADFVCVCVCVFSFGLRYPIIISPVNQRRRRTRHVYIVLTVERLSIISSGYSAR